MAALLQGIFNWFALGLMLLGAGALVLSDSRVLPPDFMLVATVPLLAHLFAHAPDAHSGLRVIAVAVNWVGAVLAASLAAAALTGIGGTLALSPFLGSAAGLYAWNAVSVAITST